jgi:hypothetical protein
MESPALERPERSAPVSDTTFTDEQFRERLEVGYAADGVTSEKIRSTLAAIREAEKSKTFWGRGLKHETSFYLNSSDPLALLHENADVEGRRVVTVAGSGDFAQVFLANGARELVIFDVSLPAAMFNELKLVGLRRLEYREYRAMFDTWKAGAAGGPIFDAASYQQVRDGLTGPACEYFDSLVREENQDLMRHDLGREDKAFNGFSRSRATKKEKAFTSFIGGVITTEAAYASLQRKAREAVVSIRVKDAVGAAGEAQNADMAYLSNVGYEPETTAGIAQSFFESGVEKVIFTTTGRYIDEDLVLKTAVESKEERPYRGMSIHSLGTDPDVLYGYLLELRKLKETYKP